MKIERMAVNNAKGRKKSERRSTELKQMTGSTRCLRRSTDLMDPTQTSAYHGPHPQEKCQKQTHLQQWWKYSEDPVFPALWCFGG